VRLDRQAWSTVNCRICSCVLLLDSSFHTVILIRLNGQLLWFAYKLVSFSVMFVRVDFPIVYNRSTVCYFYNIYYEWNYLFHSSTMSDHYSLFSFLWQPVYVAKNWSFIFVFSALTRATVSMPSFLEWWSTGDGHFADV